MTLMPTSRRLLLQALPLSILGLATEMAGFSKARAADSKNPDIWFDSVRELRLAERIDHALIGITGSTIRYRRVAPAAADPGLSTSDGWPAPLQLVSETDPAAFGAEELDGDATAALNAASRLASARGETELALGGRAFRLEGRLVIDGLVLRDFTLDLYGPQAAIRLTGHGPGVLDYHINYGDSRPHQGGEDAGVFNLHLSHSALIGRGTVTGTARRMAVSCISRADHTQIEGLISHAMWGILFNDKSRRVVDGVDYAGQSIGRGLSILGCEFHADPMGEHSGDGIEINTPRQLFSDITVAGCIVHRTVSSPSVGLGIAFAGVERLLVSDCTVYGCTSTAGAFHVEFGRDVIFERCVARDSYTGLSVGMSENVHLLDITFEDCWRFAIQSFNTWGDDSPATVGVPTRNLRIENCRFSGTGARRDIRGGPDIIIGRVEKLAIVGNHFAANPRQAASRIRFQTYDDGGVVDVLIENNSFEGSRKESPLQVDGNSRRITITDNRIEDAEGARRFLGMAAGVPRN